MESTPRNSPIGLLVWRLSMKWRARVDESLQPLGLTHAQYSLLASLYGLTRHGTRPSQRELAGFAGLEPVYVSKLLKVLEREQLVRRSVSPEDSRAVELELTDLGIERVAAAIAIVHDFLEAALAPIGGSESRQSVVLIQLLESLLGGSAGNLEANSMEEDA